jgi:hypothetical protein
LLIDMLVNGCDCSIVIKTEHWEIDVPYSGETVREAVTLLQEEASIEGDGVCRGLRKIGGVTGCVVTPLTIGTAPLLVYLAMGSAGNPIYVSETRNLYLYRFNLLPTEDTKHFDLVQDRRTNNNEQVTINKERKFYEACRVKSFELRIMRGEAIKLKLEICGECTPRVYPYTDTFQREQGERFKGDCVTYKINGQEYKNIYGITIVSKKQGGTKTEILIKREKVLGLEIPEVIDEMTITAQLLRDKHEYKYYGLFRITLKQLVLVSDETEINSADAVIGPLRYYISGSASTDIFNPTGELIP